MLGEDSIYAMNIVDRLNLFENYGGVYFRWYFQDLGHPLTDLDETLGMYRVHPVIIRVRILAERSEGK